MKREEKERKREGQEYVDSKDSGEIESENRKRRRI